MSAVLDLLRDAPVHRFETGGAIIDQGTHTGRLFFLIEGEVEIVKDTVTVGRASQPGAVFGELSALLGTAHTATVRALRPSSFYIVENAKSFLEAHPTVCVAVCELLGRRLDALNKYLVDVKRQYEGHDHLAMVDEVLESLLTRQMHRRVRPSESTIRHGELPA